MKCVSKYYCNFLNYASIFGSQKTNLLSFLGLLYFRGISCWSFTVDKFWINLIRLHSLANNVFVCTVDLALGHLYHIELGSVAGVSEVHAMGKEKIGCIPLVQKTMGGRVRTGTSMDQWV
jgi:hypothetical protein